jgi:heme-degrading monooxygenase HmoA
MFLVVFRSRKSPGIDTADYAADSQAMQSLARAQPGYFSFKSYTSQDGEDIDLSEWESEAAALNWGRHMEHRAVQAKGRDAYYESYTLFACDDPRTHRFERSET